MTSFRVYHKEASRFSFQRNSADEAPLSGCNEAARLLPAAEAVAGIAIFPNFSAEQRSRGLTDFNDLATQNPELVSQQLTSTKVFETRLIAHSLAAENDCAISY
jgi:hypothetical protein